MPKKACESQIPTIWFPGLMFSGSGKRGIPWLVTGYTPLDSDMAVSLEYLTFEPDTSVIFKVYVKTLTGKTITMDVYADLTIEGLKYGIQDKEGIQPEYQRILYEGKQLENMKTLSGSVPCKLEFISRQHL
jgi:hypothetical protein